MSEWKNPSFGGSSNNRGEWKPPQVKEDDSIEQVAMGIALAIRALFGFIVIISVNALFVYAITRLLGNDIEYRNAIFVGCLVFLWRSYDISTFRKFGKDS